MEFEEKDMSLQDLLEKREKEVYLELGKVGMNDEKRRQLMSEAKTFAEIRNANDQAENTRLNNNARNDIEEQKLLVEQERCKVEKQKIGVDAAKIFVGVLSGLGMTMLSYNMDTLFTKDNKMQKFCEKVHEMLTLRK